mmetsp:Transcript_34954/g.138412  ORF Transcript_34954/g.138412 Transcript_34954/m.138412 type:complete len:212 (-) Transcript_34954:120-755(-)
MMSPFKYQGIKAASQTRLPLPRSRIHCKISSYRSSFCPGDCCWNGRRQLTGSGRPCSPRRNLNLIHEVCILCSQLKEPPNNEYQGKAEPCEIQVPLRAEDSLLPRAQRHSAVQVVRVCHRDLFLKSLDRLDAVKNTDSESNDQETYDKGERALNSGHTKYFGDRPPHRMWKRQLSSCERNSAVQQTGRSILDLKNSKRNVGFTRSYHRKKT